MESDYISIAFKLAGYYQVSIPACGTYNILIQLRDPYADGKMREWLKVMRGNVDVTSEFFEENIDIRPTMANLYSIINLVRRKETTK